MPNTSKPGSFKNLINQIEGGARLTTMGRLNAPSSLGALAGFMGLPIYSRSQNHQGQVYSPQEYTLKPAGAAPAAADGSGNNPGGDDPANPGFPGNAYPKNVIPQWWVDWYNSTGKYGGVPPVQGLL